MNTDTQTVNVTLEVAGRKTGDLWTNLAVTPMGSLQAGRIVMSIHTNKNNAGEISGDVVPAA